MPEAVDPAPMSWSAKVAYAIFLPLGFLALVFAPVGRLDWRPGWVFIAIVTAAFAVSAAVVGRFNPIIYRARSRFQPGTKGWDLILLSAMLPAMVAEIPLATFDAGRMGWSSVPQWVVVLGYLLVLAGIAVTGWAQVVNPFFEPGVRIQSERNQSPVSTGPYRFVRHPGYVGAVGIFLGFALALASWWALIPAGAAIVLLILRTAWEDRLLRAELPGYADYARRTRFRLAPRIW